MYSLETVRKLVKENVMIVGVQEIESNFWGTEVTLKGVTISIQEENLLYIKEVFAHIDMYVECTDAYPVLIHSETKEIIYDFENPVADNDNELPSLLMYALIIFFTDHAKGQKQKTFLYGLEKALKEDINKNN